MGLTGVIPITGKHRNDNGITLLVLFGTWQVTQPAVHHCLSDVDNDLSNL